MEIGDLAHNLADRIYFISKECLMAHSIRATEEYLSERLRRPYAISVNVAMPNRFLGKRAMAVIKADHAEIVAGPKELGFEQQRLGIAHELAHIILHFERGAESSPGMLESACKLFEEHLCLRHHDFYSKHANIQNILFHGLSEKWGENRPYASNSDPEP